MRKVKLTDICSPKQWKTIPTSELLDEGFPVYGANGIIGYYKEYNHETPVVTITCRGATCGSINVTVPKSYITGNAMCLDELHSDIDLKYLYYCLLHYDFAKVISGTAQPQITRQGLEKVILSIGTPKEQEKIVSLLSRTESIINDRKVELQVLDDLIKARFVEMFGDPKYNHNELVNIGSIGILTSGGTPSRAVQEYYLGDIRWFSAGELNNLYLGDSSEHITEEAIINSSAKMFKKGTLLIGMYDTAAFKMGILTEDASSNQACANLQPNDNYNIVWLYYMFSLMKPVFLKERQGVRQKNLSLSKIKELKFPNASIAMQNEFAGFVKEIDKSKFVVQKALDEAQLLFDSLMQQYFG